MSQKSDLFKVLSTGAKLTFQGGGAAYRKGTLPTILLRETKGKRKEVRDVVAILDSTAEGFHVKDHVGEVWVAVKLGNGNYRAKI